MPKPTRRTAHQSMTTHRRTVRAEAIQTLIVPPDHHLVILAGPISDGDIRALGRVVSDCGLEDRTLFLTQIGAGIAPTDQVLHLLGAATLDGEAAWSCQCGHLNEGAYQDPTACGGCRFECRPDMVDRHWALVPKGAN